MEQTRKKSSLVKQAAILAAAGLLVRIMGFLYRLPLTNMIGDEGNGLYSAGFYIYMFFLILSSAGLPAAISKMVSERMALKQYKNAHRVFKVSFLVAGVGGLLGSLILGFGAKSIAVFIQSPGSYYSLLSLSPTILIVALMSVYRGYFQGMNTMVPTAISQIVEQVFNAVFSVWMAYLLIGRGIEYGAAGGTMGTGIGALTGLLFLAFVYVVARPRLHKKMEKEPEGIEAESYKALTSALVGIAFPIIVGTAIFSITNLIDMKMVMSRLLASGAFDEKQAQVLYGQLTGKYVLLTTLPVAIATALGTAAVPSIASSVALGDRVVVRKKVNMALRLTMILAMPSAVGIGVLGDAILHMLFPLYPEGGVLLTVGAVSIVFLSLAQICTAILQGVGWVSTPAIYAGVGAIFKIAFNYILIGIPGINVLGAVISTIICYVVAAVLDMIAMVKATGVGPQIQNTFMKPLLASAGMGVVCYGFYQGVFMFLHNNTIATLTSVLLGIGVYFLILLLIRGITKEDMEMIPMGSRISRKLIHIGVMKS